MPPFPYLLSADKFLHISHNPRYFGPAKRIPFESLPAKTSGIPVVLNLFQVIEEIVLRHLADCRERGLCVGLRLR